MGVAGCRPCVPRLRWRSVRGGCGRSRGPSRRARGDHRTHDRGFRDVPSGTRDLRYRRLARPLDMAVGGIVGSNVFNVLGVLGVSALIVPLDSGHAAAHGLHCCSRCRRRTAVAACALRDSSSRALRARCCLHSTSATWAGALSPSRRRTWDDLQARAATRVTCSRDGC